LKSLPLSRGRPHAIHIFQQFRRRKEIVNHLQTMEHRLDMAIVLSNSNLTKLSALRSQMDEFRKSRLTFSDVIWGTKTDRT
jgi:hypothetical protein